MKLSGISDEAGKPIAVQVKAHRELGWKCIDLRAVDGVNVTSVSDAKFQEIAEAITGAGLEVTNFASGVCCWGRSVLDDFRQDLDEFRRAVPRMHRLGAKTLRVMSCPHPPGVAVEDEQFRREAVRRLRELAKIAELEGITLVHEQVGEGWTRDDPERMCRLLQAVDSPRFKLLLDIANFGGPDAGERSWLAYERTREHVAYVHLKDRTAGGEFTWFGEGVIPVRKLLSALRADGYDGTVSMEPHIAAIHHTARRASPEVTYDSYIRNGRKVEQVLRETAIDWR